MRVPKLKTNYDFVSNERLPRYAADVVSQTAGSLFWPDGAARATAVKTFLSELEALLNETAHPTPSQSAQRDGARTRLRDSLGDLATRLNLDFPGQADALLSSGLELVDVPVAHKEPPVRELISNVQLLNAGQSFYLLITFKRPKGAVQVVCRYTDDATLPFKNWCCKFGGPREILLGPFPEGTRVGAAVAALFTETDEPEYSAVLWRYAQE